MIHNATLLRVDPAEEGVTGAVVDVRVALTPLTTEQGRMNREMDWGAEWVAYVPAARVPSPAPVVGGRVLIRTGGAGTENLYCVACVIERLGRTLGHMQWFLSPAD